MRRLWHIFKELFPAIAEDAIVRKSDRNTLVVQISRVQNIFLNGERKSMTKPQILIFTYKSSTNWSLKTQ